MADSIANGTALGAQTQRISELESGMRALRQQLRQRESMLTILNQRLMQLEQRENGLSGMERAAGRSLSDNGPGIASLQEEVSHLRAENESLREERRLVYETKLFRWAKPFRRLYATARGQAL